MGVSRELSFFFFFAAALFVIYAQRTYTYCILLQLQTGEIVKFAGDAVYVIWNSERTVDDDATHAMNIEKSTACAIAINAECNNYKVSKSYNRRSSVVSSNKSTRRGSVMSESSGNSLRSQGEVLYRYQDKNAEYEERGAVLNVYCGVSEGIMAGIDVVANSRAEFFLVGRPLKGELSCSR